MSNVLIVKTVDDEMYDHEGKIMPSSGLVTAEDWLFDNDVSNGLKGVLWGVSINGSFLSHNPSHKWLIIQAEGGNNIKKIGNLVKFHQGYILHCGDKNSSISFLRNKLIVKDNLETEVNSLAITEIAGVDIVSSESNGVAVSQGFLGQALAQGCGGLALSTGCRGEAIGSGDESNAITTHLRGSSVARGDLGTAISLGFEGRAESIGILGKSFTVEDGASAISSGDKSISICLGFDGVAEVGSGGMLIMAWEDANEKKRIAIGYEGEGIEAGILYKCENGKFAKVCESV